MAGLSATTPIPEEIILEAQSRQLVLGYPDGTRYALPCEYLRVYSPSAEVRGHGVGPGTLQSGKRNVAIEDVLPVGNYAVKLVFDDGHSSGLYSWEYLFELGQKHDAYWQLYLERLAAEGGSRDA
ncbi:DUF971 domain-containing protein [Chitinilyticum litopenaei]|uniref:DUF971 domain-containing protein n=2 Tax=Chitinilyticum piscinae TaxID=2866724 RepID=A0A8J7FJK0_9NEIS|nr:DUF971 domain-containing protein [Chitinilyticum piscinae]MBE9609047.1 DUF971 domain-containing protein [Chitinilyticum piscinae]